MKLRFGNEASLERLTAAKCTGDRASKVRLHALVRPEREEQSRRAFRARDSHLSPGAAARAAGSSPARTRPLVGESPRDPARRAGGWISTQPRRRGEPP